MSSIKLDQIEQITKANVGLSNVDNTSDLNKPISTATQSALNLKADTTALTSGLATKENTITAGTTAQYYRGDKTFQALDKIAIGLANVDNTADINKPISTVQQNAFNLKADLASPTFTGVVSGVTKSMVGLGNVDNTSDVNKPVSTAQATANTTVQNFAIQRANHTGTQLSSTISDFVTTVRATVLTGLSLATNQIISATDTVLQALGYLQAQITFNKVKRTSVQLLDVTANHTVSASLGGDYRVSNRAITIVGVGAYVDTAGVTGLATIDIKVGGVSIMTTNKITIDSAEKTSETAVTAPVLTTTNVTADSIFTFDITGIQTIPAKGLKTWINYIYV